MSEAVNGAARRTKVFDLHCDTIDQLCMRDVEPYRSEIAEQAKLGIDTSGTLASNGGAPWGTLTSMRPSVTSSPPSA